MKNTKRRNIIIIGIILIALIILIVGIYISTKKEPKKENPITGINEGMTHEEFYNWETKLNIKAIEILDETFNEKFPLDKNGEFTITLYELETKYKKDLSQYNTIDIKCDLEKSIIMVKKEDDGYEKKVMLSCINMEEQSIEHQN